MAPVAGGSGRPRSYPPHQPYLLHLSVLVLFAALAVLFTRPLSTRLGSAILGAPGDNFSFLWNFWWAKTAVASHQSVFSTPMIFAPLGASLATHTYVPLMTVGAAYAFPSVSPAAIYNSAILLAVFLNFACAYLAAFTITGDRIASVFAGIAFGGAPFLIVRAGAHLNVLSAWGLPLTLAATVGFTRRPTAIRGVPIAVALALVAYTDYYYFIFGAVMTTLWIALAIWRVSVNARPLTTARTRAVWTLAAILAALLAVATAIALTGGADTALGPIRLRMTDTFNARVIAGFLFFAILLVWKWPTVRVRPAAIVASPEGQSCRLEPARTVRALIPAAVGGLLLISPLLVAAFNVWRAGDYTSQTYVWRSAPPGIDVASLLMGNALHPLTGSFTTRIYRHLGLNGVEDAAWLGLVPMLLLAFAWKKGSGHFSESGTEKCPDPFFPVAACFWIAGVFFVWSLGPYLRVFGYNTAVMLPQTVLRYVPIVANARIPGRAFTLVQLMVAMLGAMVLASLPGPPRRKALIGAAAIAGVLLDFLPATRMVTALDTPRVYAALKDMPGGVVLNVPFGIRDGFGQRGNPQAELLFYQTVHGHPQMGGFVARLSTRVTSAYERDPVLSAMLDMSEGRAPKSVPAGPCHDSLACDARYVVVDEQAASPDLQSFVRATFPAARMAVRDKALALYTTAPQ